MNSFSFSIIDLFLIILTLAVIGSFIYNPRVGFLLLFLTKFSADLFWQHRLLGFNINILQIQGVLFFILCCILYIRFNKKINRHPLKIILLTLIISNVVASIWGFANSKFTLFELVASPLSLMHIVEWNMRFLNLTSAFVFIPVVFSKKSDFRILVKIFMFATITPVILGIIENYDGFFFKNVISGNGYSVKLFPRLTAGYHDSAVLAIVLFTGLSTSFYLFYTETLHVLKWIYFIYFMTIMFLMHNTYSRTLWLTAALFIILFFVYQKKYLPALLLLLFIVTVSATLPSIQKRFHQEILYLKNNNSESIKVEKTGTGRIGLWKVATDHYKHLDIVSKIIGTGGAYGSHNQFIAFLLKNGLIGLLLFFLLIYLIYRKLIRTKNMANISEYALVMGLFVSSVLITNQFIQLWDHITYNYFFWGITGMLICNTTESN